MTLKKTPIKLSNIVFLTLILLLIIPSTRTSIQVAMHQTIAKLIPVSIEDNGKQVSYDHWQLKGIDGTEINFKDLSGKVVVINFWATWCPPCIAEMKSLDDLSKFYQKDKDIIFLYISNERKETLATFVEKNNYSFNPFTALTAVPEVFETKSIPRTYIIDKNGRIVVDSSGASDWNSDSIRDLLNHLKGS